MMQCTKENCYVRIMVMDKLSEGRKVFNTEIQALEIVRDSLNSTFLRTVEAITNCEGKIVMTGMGKSGHVARKIAATLSSLGTPSFYLHPAEAMHGDLGMVSSKDIVIAISYSGESEEVISILPNIKLIGTKLISITGNINSTLSQYSDVPLILPAFNEACHLGLAPTSSTTAAMALGDAIAVVASEINSFDSTQFGILHPAGTLGKKLLLKVSDLAQMGSDNAVIFVNQSLKEAIVELSEKGLGIVTVIDSIGKIKGVITDGDLRRLLEKEVDVYSLTVKEVMTPNPVSISENKMAIEALQVLKEKNISCMPVLSTSNIVIGTIRLQTILHAGIL